jgi:type IV secretory pathway TraG/TraD family ATPase VirD4
VLSAAVATLDHVATQSGPPLSVRHWVRSGTGVLFLPYSAGQIAALRSLISTWLRIAIFETMSQPEGDQRLWYVIDELDALGAIDGLKDALARLRKFGGRCVLGMQSIAQVRACYGEADARTIIENCGTSLILRCSASEAGGTAQFASQLIGERQIRRRELSRTVSRGGLFDLHATRYQVTRAERTHIEPAVLSAEIEQLEDFHGFLKLASRPEWRRVRVSAR